MVHPDYLLIVAGMALVTYVPRWLPLFFLAQQRLPRWFVEWLDLIPVAILSALIFPDLFVRGDPRQLVLLQPKSLAAVPTLLFALKTRSLGGTILVGMLLYWVTSKWWMG
jgi:branched-subunit amino acid transport protein